MLENLLQLVKDNAGQAIIDNPAIPNEKNDAACETAANSIFDSLKNVAGNGGIESIATLLNSGGNAGSHPVVNQLSNNVAGDLMKKFGLDSGAAGNIVRQLIPVVMNKLAHKTNDPNDNSFDLKGIIGSLTGGKGGGDIFGAVKGLFGN